MVMAVMFAAPTLVQASVAMPSWLASLAAGIDARSESGDDENAAVDSANDPEVLCVCAQVLDDGRPMSKSTHWKSDAATPAGAVCPVHHVGGGLHVLPEQTGVPPVHACAQVPQLAGSFVVSTHAPLQSAGVDPVHVMPHEVPSQLAIPLPLEGLGHAAHELVPHQEVLVLLTHVPLQSCVPPGHLQMEPEQCLPPLHANVAPQPPQLASSEVSSTHAPAQGV
jgi:hypothetical protein